MSRHGIPRVIDNRLLPPERGDQNFTPISIGSEAWYIWLNEPASGSFAFSSSQGNLTARREERHGTWYWYAYRSRSGHLHKVYLGKSEGLTPKRLHEAANMFSAPSANHSELNDKLHSSPTVSPLISSNSVSSLRLLITKISLPLARVNMVARPRLLQRMNAAMSGALTLIVAPAGWGKTTLLNAWYADASLSALPLSWVSLDASDSDPIRFWTYVITALNILHPGVGEVPLALLYASPPSPIEDVLTSLFRSLLIFVAQIVDDVVIEASHGSSQSS